ncbi:hypothetical protein EC971742_3426, partial [Escherichia coli 97.1742]
AAILPAYKPICISTAIYSNCGWYGNGVPDTPQTSHPALSHQRIYQAVW